MKKKFVLFSLVVLALILCFAGKDNVFTWIKTAGVISDQERQIENLRNMNENLDLRIESLSSNRDTLETFAREKYHFAASGDDVFLFEED